MKEHNGLSLARGYKSNRWLHVSIWLGLVMGLVVANPSLDMDALNSLWAHSDEVLVDSRASVEVAPGLLQSQLDEINQNAVEHALRVVIPTVSLIESSQNIANRNEHPSESGLRSVTESLSYKKPEVVYRLDASAPSVSQNSFLEIDSKLEKPDVKIDPFNYYHHVMYSKGLGSAAESLLSETGSFIQIGQKLTESISGDFFPSMRELATMLGMENSPGKEGAKPASKTDKTDASATPIPPPTPAMMEAASKAQAAAQAKVKNDGAGYVAPHAPPSFSEWLNGGAAGAGETAENLGIPYKPDPRRHPPPPPVPAPPPPPPPSFGTESPLSAYRFKEVEKKAAAQPKQQAGKQQGGKQQAGHKEPPVQSFMSLNDRITQLSRVKPLKKDKNNAQASLQP